MVVCSPELCVVMLLVPTLKGDEVLIVQGAQATISMAGYGRSAHLFQILKPDDSTLDPLS
jgi:hypothetical protein